eukprot:1138223-Pelagomonas_calceolata.AAC.1
MATDNAIFANGRGLTMNPHLLTINCFDRRTSTLASFNVCPLYSIFQDCSMCTVSALGLLFSSVDVKSVLTACVHIVPFNSHAGDDMILQPENVRSALSN